jgi:hypothetical protein
MRRSKLLLGVVTAAACAVLPASAQAAFPNFSDCPRSQSVSCADIVARSGSMSIKGFDVPLRDGTLEIRGGLGTQEFIPPRGTNGFFARPVEVPGGLIGIDLPIPFNDVTATPELAGPASSIRLSIADFSISVPIKLHLTNPLLGPNCYIGSNRNPVQQTLSVTRQGAISPASNYVAILGQVNEDNRYSIPGATGCALGLGFINSIVNLKLGLPSSSGNNAMSLTSDIALQAAAQ